MQENTGAPDAWTFEFAAGHAASSKAHLSPPAVALQELIISSPMDCNTRYRRAQCQEQIYKVWPCRDNKTTFPYLRLATHATAYGHTHEVSSCCDQTGHGPLTDQTAMSCWGA